MTSYRWAAFALCLFATSTAQAAERPAALVLDAQGAIRPPLESFSEVPAGAKIELGQGARLVLVHYLSCRQITAVGGSLLVSEDRLDIESAQLERDQSQRCPQEVRLTASGLAGGILMRGFSRTDLSSAPECILVGRRADSFKSARITTEGRTVAEVMLKDRKLGWPAQLPPLEPERPYRLELIPGMSGEAVFAVDFSAVTNGQQWGQRPCLLRVD